MAHTNGMRAQSVRQRNLALIFETVRSTGPVARSELVATTGLTRSAIGGLVRELVSLGLVREDAARSDGRPGRPSPIVHVDDRHVATLAIDVGVRSAAVAIVGVDGVVIRSARDSMPDAPVTPDQIVDLVIELAGQVDCSAGRGAGRQLVGAGVAIPALVRQPGNVVAFAPNLDWRDVAFGDLLADALSLRLETPIPVTVNNEAELAGFAESRLGAAANRDDVVYVHGDVGVGGAVVVGGERLRGHRGFSGEIGHVPVSPVGRPCHCGSRGCWETEIGSPALRERLGSAVIDADDLVTAVHDAISVDDVKVRSALAEHGRWMGVGLSGLINILDPEVIVLGGLLGRLLPLYEASMLEELDSRRMRAVERSVAVVAGQLGVDATLIGASQVAFGSVVDDPFSVLRSRP